MQWNLSLGLEGRRGLYKWWWLPLSSVYWFRRGQWQHKQNTGGRNSRQVCKDPEEAQSYTAGCRGSQTLKDLPQQYWKGYGSPEGWTHSVESAGCMLWCFILLDVACWLDTDCSVSLSENMLLPSLKLEVAPVLMNWYVSFLPWNAAAVSVKEVVLAALILRVHILQHYPYWEFCCHRWSHLSHSNYLRFFGKANLSQIKVLKVNIQIITQFLPTHNLPKLPSFYYIISS